MNSLPVEEKFGQILPARNKAKLSEWCESGHCLMLLPVFAMAPQLTGVSEASLHGEPLIYRLFATATSSTGVSEVSHMASHSSVGYSTLPKYLQVRWMCCYGGVRVNKKVTEVIRLSVTFL